VRIKLPGQPLKSYLVSPSVEESIRCYQMAVDDHSSLRNTGDLIKKETSVTKGAIMSSPMRVLRSKTQNFSRKSHYNKLDRQEIESG
jgi:hypothetical protein